MKKAKPTKITKFEKKDQYNNTSFSIEFDNGDKGFYSTKSEEQTKFVIGQEIEYNIEEKIGKNNNKWYKLSLSSDQKQFPGGGGRQQIDPRVQMISFAMSYTKDLIVGQQVLMQNLEKEFSRIYAAMISKL